MILEVIGTVKNSHGSYRSYLGFYFIKSEQGVCLICGTEIRLKSGNT